MDSCDKSDDFGGFGDDVFPSSGYFRLEPSDGRRWFITPSGHKFFPVSLSHIFTYGSEKTVQSQYGGNSHDWIIDWIAKYKELGFNSALGGASSACRNMNGFVNIPEIEDYFRENKIPFAVGLFPIPHPDQLASGEERPDVFDDSYVNNLINETMQKCSQYSNDPWVLGYYYGYGSFLRPIPWIISLFNSDGAACQVFRSILQDKYENIRNYNKAHDVSFESFGDLVKCDLPHYRSEDTQAAKEDLQEFKRAMALQLYGVLKDAIREVDKNHLIFGSYVKEQSFDVETWKALSPLVDVAAPQHWNPQFPFETLSSEARLPVLVSDEVCGRLPANTSDKDGVTVEDKAEMFRMLYRRHLGDPNVSGVAFCGTMYDLQDGPLLSMFEGIWNSYGERRAPLWQAIVASNEMSRRFATDIKSELEIQMLDDELRGFRRRAEARYSAHGNHR